jgi:hypothetical protein
MLKALKGIDMGIVENAEGNRDGAAGVLGGMVVEILTPITGIRQFQLAVRGRQVSKSDCSQDVNRLLHVCVRERKEGVLRDYPLGHRRVAKLQHICAEIHRIV